MARALSTSEEKQRMLILGVLLREVPCVRSSLSAARLREGTGIHEGDIYTRLSELIRDGWVGTVVPEEGEAACAGYRVKPGQRAWIRRQVETWEQGAGKGGR